MKRNPIYHGRTEQSKAANRRQRDAETLQAAGHWVGAMYMMGYAVECRLKAALMEMHDCRTLRDLESKMNRGSRQNVMNMFTHDLEFLFGLTGARDRMNETQRAAFKVCRGWRPEWRYDPSAGKPGVCTDFMAAAKVFSKFVAGSL